MVFLDSLRACLPISKLAVEISRARRVLSSSPTGVHLLRDSSRFSSKSRLSAANCSATTAFRVSMEVTRQVETNWQSIVGVTLSVVKPREKVPLLKELMAIMTI